MLFSNYKIEDIRNSFEMFKNQIIFSVNAKDKAYEELIEENRRLEKVNTNLKDKLQIHENEINKVKVCVHCNKNFISKDNDEKSCCYHPGKLKYYSCRGCGGDEYYTCCKKCSKCSTGCKWSKHLAN
jgi:hypothetical protein